MTKGNEMKNRFTMKTTEDGEGFGLGRTCVVCVCGSEWVEEWTSSTNVDGG